MGQAVRQPGAILLDLNARVDARRTTEPARGQRLLQLGIATGDLVIIVGATLLAAVRGVDMLALLPVANDVNTVALSVGPAIIVAWMLANVARGSYTKAHIGVGTVEYARVLGAAGLTAGAIGISSYLTKFELSRVFFVLLFLVGVPVLLLWRWSARRIVHRLHRRGRLLTKVIISGSESRIDEVASVLRREKWLGFQIIGALVPSTRPVEQTPGGVPVIGFTNETASNALASEADLVLFSEGAFPSAVDFRRIAWDLEGSDVDLIVVPASPTSPGADRHAPGRRAAAACTSSRRRPEAARPRSAPSTLSAPASRCSSLSPVMLAPSRCRQAAGRRPGPLPPDPRRPRRAALRVPQVPHHGRRRGGPPGRRRPPQRDADGVPLQDRGRPADHAHRAASCAGSPSTSCRS